MSGLASNQTSAKLVLPGRKIGQKPHIDGQIMYAHMYTSIYVLIHMECTCTYMYMLHIICVCVCVFIFMSACMYVYTCMHACMHACMHEDGRMGIQENTSKELSCDRVRTCTHKSCVSTCTRFITSRSHTGTYMHWCLACMCKSKLSLCPCHACINRCLSVNPRSAETRKASTRPPTLPRTAPPNPKQVILCRYDAFTAV